MAGWPLLWATSVQARVATPAGELAAIVERAGSWPAGAGEGGSRADETGDRCGATGGWVRWPARGEWGRR
jgi:hypothetical protein